MSTTLANPAKMIAHGAPRMIHNEEELAQYTEALFKLTSIDSPNADEIEAINLLSLLVSTYEDEHYPLPAGSPAGIVRFVMDQHDLKQKDLLAEFGTESAVSMFLSGQRSLSLQQILALTKRFRIPADLLLER